MAFNVNMLKMGFFVKTPHLFGNEYHSRYCRTSGVITIVEIVEGKDKPCELGKP